MISVKLDDSGTKLVLWVRRIGKYEIHIDPSLVIRKDYNAISFNILVKDTETDGEKYLRCQNGKGGKIFASKFEITETLQYRVYYVRGKKKDSWSEWKSLENN
jgi:hypothetical protein